MPLVRNKPRFDAKAPAARARSITLHTLQRARRARRELLLIVPLTIATIVAYIFREEIFGVDTPVRVAAAVVLVVLGWALARDLGRWVEPGCSAASTPARRARSASSSACRSSSSRRSPRSGSPG